ncbi:hypothetical protein M0R04_05125 [Candidatus Dojkabacteria bacterium]|jgi:hypothetical protein|nr:hypothetical protein [Candidatus Dojkabacteria bacterium]
MDKTEPDTRGNTNAALTLRHKTSEDIADNNFKKKKVIKDILKKKSGKDVFDPDPELSENDTVIKT